MYVLVALFCMMSSPMVNDCHIVVTKEMLVDRNKCIVELKKISTIEAGQGYVLSSAKCHSISRSDI